MFRDSVSFAQAMGCFGCFGYSRRTRQSSKTHLSKNRGFSRDRLIDDVPYYDDLYSCDSDETSNAQEEEEEMEQQNRSKRSEEILKFKLNNGLICRQFPVKETNKLIRGEDENGNKMINEYVREYKIGSGSYGKVVLYRSSVDGKHYAIKAFHKSYLLRLRVAPSETAMSDVLREVMIMKMLEHPNIVNLLEVIDDPETDHFYMVLEYVDGKWAYDESGRPGAVGEETARKYLQDVVAGLMYLHAHNIIHGDIKPDNLLVSSNGTVKIGDFSVSQSFEDDNDELRRSPGTPVFTAPECCVGITYRGRAADTWAVGVTLYCMILGQYPFLGDSLQDTYDKIVHNPLVIPDGLNPLLRSLIEGLLCKDPEQRMTLKDVSEHPWVMREDRPVPEYLCWCKRNSAQGTEAESNGGVEISDSN
ncbi:PREDICTED: serine/threonine-protein kinase GRIK2 [Tarenaya hassleriana]|uniref:serine/threonine-protein kinase GRIK2 n=1 Tax=Tarenaya hassleriana TaxID=28532 RepID=UPI00053C62AC|nr:PREDICTED: serine/threonine-protein kinase GRIK2 [Tarenaya hassleriana]XP_010520364.1 PREDICTED: serine/threonine-protein kinase GRIK2 [Tarenaya hassleriana]XP_010520365.1 PREDICTED: serine/threonine-protein kinase GRIK2 [Tarenaya hassleriana]